ncbi:hypothetical protein BC830DRAFT_1084089 [Chytriomyces sp. MP71]|nr:hypothetical protein BC830DRAFT_1084089 [Chytriomyces sp. MP71]
MKVSAIAEVGKQPISDIMDALKINFNKLEADIQNSHMSSLSDGHESDSDGQKTLSTAKPLTQKTSPPSYTLPPFAPTTQSPQPSSPKEKLWSSFAATATHKHQHSGVVVSRHRKNLSTASSNLSVLTVRPFPPLPMAKVRSVTDLQCVSEKMEAAGHENKWQSECQGYRAIIEELAPQKTKGKDAVSENSRILAFVVAAVMILVVASVPISWPHLGLMDTPKAPPTLLGPEFELWVFNQRTQSHEKEVRQKRCGGRPEPTKSAFAATPTLVPLL